jgi:membrane associated rhomboid family serine protease
LEAVEFFAWAAAAVALARLGVAAFRVRSVGSASAAAAVLGLLVAGLLWESQWLLWGAVSVATVFVLLPSAVHAQARRRAAAGDFDGAAALLEPVLFLLRESGAAAWCDAWRAADAWCRGEPAPLERLRVQLISDAPPGHRAILPWLTGVTRDWEAARLSGAPELEARALCELGDVDQGVEVAARAWMRRTGSMWSLMRARWLMLPAFAFSGRVDVVERLGRMLRLSEPARELWRITALSAAGRRPEADDALDALLARPTLPPGLRTAALDRRMRMPGSARLGPAALDALGTARREVFAGDVLRARPPWTVPVLWVVGGGLLGMFALQASAGGVTEQSVAWRLGALQASGALPEETWRLFAYGALHHGWPHLLANLIAIGILGPMVVAGVGSAGFLMVFVSSVVLAGVGISLFGTAGLTLGASGGAMGLLGAVLAVSLAHPALRRTRTANGLAWVLISVVSVQTVFDALSPNVSMTGHLVGGAAGLVAGLFCAWVVPRRLD